MTKHSGERNCRFGCGHDDPEPVCHFEYVSLRSTQREHDSSWIRDGSKLGTRSDWSCRRNVDLSKHGNGADLAKHRSDPKSGTAGDVVSGPRFLHTWFDSSCDTRHDRNERSFCRSACQFTREHGASGDQRVSDGFAVR